MSSVAGEYVNFLSDYLPSFQPFNFVEGKFDTAAGYATDSFDLAEQYIGTLSALLSEIELPAFDLSDIDIPSVLPIDYNARPTLGDVEIPTDFPAAPVKDLQLEVLPTFPEITFPLFTAEAPGASSAVKPTLATVSAPDDAPAVAFVTVPTKPSLAFPVVPTLDEVSIPDAPSLTVPVFDVTAPVDGLDNPSATLVFSEAGYNSAVYADLIGKIVDGIQDGGTGLDPTVEAEIFERAIVRQRLSNDRAYQEVEDFFAGKGASLPMGAMAAKLQEISRDITLAESEITGKILIEQAELAQKNTHFLLDLGLKTEQVFRDFHLRQEGLRLQAATALVETTTKVYELGLALHATRVEAYRAEAAVYESRVKAVLSEIEIYKGKMEGARVTAEVQNHLVNLYLAQLRGTETEMRLYVTEMEGAKIAVEVERAKLERYRLEVETFSARLQAEKVKFDVYATEVAAEGQVVKTYLTEVEAYTAQLDAEKGKVDVVAAEALAKVEVNKVKVAEYGADVDAYKAEIGSKVAEIEGTTGAFQATVSAYEAETSAQGMQYATQIKVVEAEISVAKLEISKAIAEIEAVRDAYLAMKKLQISGAEGMANVSAQLAAAALTSTSASASVGRNDGYNYSRGYNFGSALSEQHYYDDTEV